MATLKTGTTIAGQTAWHVGNDGPGSGLDADTLDGLHASQLMPSQAAASLPVPRRVGDLGVDSDSGYYAPWDYAWQTPTLLNGWVNYGDIYAPARYRKTMSGLVIIEGLVKNGTANTNIFTLPVGYRPSHHTLFPTLDGGNKSARLTVYSTDGNVLYSQLNGTNGYLTLCCHFYGAK